MIQINKIKNFHFKQNLVRGVYLNSMIILYVDFISDITCWNHINIYKSCSKELNDFIRNYTRQEFMFKNSNLSIGLRSKVFK